MDECLALNANAEETTSPEYFFGELIPPYIDILGRGPHFRPSDQSSLKYQSLAKCYKNSQVSHEAVFAEYTVFTLFLTNASISATREPSIHADGRLLRPPI